MANASHAARHASRKFEQAIRKPQPDIAMRIDQTL